MRLRQAHAILETVTALEAAALGIDMAPFDYDEPGHTRPSGGDQMEGGCELTDPDRAAGEVAGGLLPLHRRAAALKGSGHV
ncbi:hypothetical protein QCN29_14915 [Streptomyces sp. HNM0663]|uniref:Uncharacterized protein n=1 Tax=Streptomyces chengmaiensis TaxID=3040919 RepID=A0ABT6HMW8_9ACTN|nr:hypothetical protein [Streptomyces chengmaiensis]MDH2390059.1 hypothetical protein [Streptomyces chengmaiensis]